MTVLRITVYGRPSPQGSKIAFINRATGRAGMKEATEKSLRPWRDSVAVAAAEARADAEFDMLDGPIRLEVTFLMPRPASAPKRVRFPWRKPDLSKLIRAVEDSLTSAGVYRDDSRIVDLIACKRFGTEFIGAQITVTGIDEADLPAPVPVPTPVQVQTLFDVPPISVDVGAL